MTLATEGSEGPWAAPVYYVHYRSALYFFSSPASRHVRQAGGSQKCAAAVYEDSTTWEDIRGVQMTGKVEEVGLGREMARVLACYLEKFPFVRNFFSGAEPNLHNLFDKFRVRLYRFYPSAAFYSDNRVRFGFREQVELPIVTGENPGKYDGRAKN